jgi:SAM-dependent methyltransferase
VTALDEWRAALQSWALPEEILSAVEESPWTYPWDVFKRRAREAMDGPRSPSAVRALEALPEGGSVIDVGSGAGAASLALIPRPGRIAAVDQSEEMLRSFAELADEAGVDHARVQGSWPEIASEVEPADVVVCHHVLYNVADLEPFVRALTDHALRRVVAEITAEHPRAEENELWKRLHGIDRPTRPTATDAERALNELHLDPKREDWDRPREIVPDREAMLDRLRLELALPADRRDDLIAALGDNLAAVDGGWILFGPTRRIVTLWWDS